MITKKSIKWSLIILIIGVISLSFFVLLILTSIIWVENGIFNPLNLTLKDIRVSIFAAGALSIFASISTLITGEEE